MGSDLRDAQRVYGREREKKVAAKEEERPPMRKSLS